MTKADGGQQHNNQPTTGAANAGSGGGYGGKGEGGGKGGGIGGGESNTAAKMTRF